MSKTALPTEVSVGFPYSDATGILDAINGVRIIEEDGLHTRYFLEFKGSPEYIGSTLRSGAPFWLGLDNESTTTTHHGYVDSLARISRPAQNVEVRGRNRNEDFTTVAGLGITYPMKHTTLDVHEGPLSRTMETLIARNRLQAAVEPVAHVQVVPQKGRSDWSVLRELADLVGYAICMRGAVVYCMSYAQLFAELASVSPFLPRTNPSAQRYRGQITMSTEDLSDNNAHTDRWRTSHSVSGINPVTGLVTSSTVGTGLFANLEQKVIGRSSRSTELKATGLAVKSALNLQMSTEGVGWQLATAGGFVYLEDGGWWWVKKVIHTIRNNDYSMEMDLRSSGDMLYWQRPALTPTVNTTATVTGRPPTLTSVYQIVNGVQDWSRGARWVST